MLQTPCFLGMSRIYFLLYKPYLNYRFHNDPPFFRIMSQLKPVHVLTSHFFKNHFSLRPFYDHILHVVPFFHWFLPNFSLRPADQFRQATSGQCFGSWTWLAYSLSRRKYHFCTHIVAVSIRHTWRRINRTCYYVTCRHLIKSLHYNLNTVWDKNIVTRHLKHIVCLLQVNLQSEHRIRKQQVPTKRPYVPI